MASKKKGLSLEEKRKKMMEIFFETKDVYLLKGEKPGLWILIDSIRIQANQNFRRQFLSQIFLKSKFESNQIKKIPVLFIKVFLKKSTGSWCYILPFLVVKFKKKCAFSQ
jgi:hypothetical protein